MATNEQILKATDMVDKALNSISGQQLVSSSEMTDLLLDIRLYLMFSCMEKETADS
jgi:hypothetical protein